MAKYKASSFQTGYVQRTALDPSKKDYAKAKQLAASTQEEVKKLANMQKSVEAQTAHYFKGLTGIDSYELASYSKTMGAVQDFLGSTLTTIGKAVQDERTKAEERDYTGKKDEAEVPREVPEPEEESTSFDLSKLGLEVGRQHEGYPIKSKSFLPESDIDDGVKELSSLQVNQRAQRYKVADKFDAVGQPETARRTRLNSAGLTINQKGMLAAEKVSGFSNWYESQLNSNSTLLQMGDEEPWRINDPNTFKDEEKLKAASRYLLKKWVDDNAAEMGLSRSFAHSLLRKPAEKEWSKALSKKTTNLRNEQSELQLQEVDNALLLSSQGKPGSSDLTALLGTYFDQQRPWLNATSTKSVNTLIHERLEKVIENAIATSTDPEAVTDAFITGLANTPIETSAGVSTYAKFFPTKYGEAALKGKAYEVLQERHNDRVAGQKAIALQTISNKVEDLRKRADDEGVSLSVLLKRPEVALELESLEQELTKENFYARNEISTAMGGLDIPTLSANDTIAHLEDKYIANNGILLTKDLDGVDLKAAKEWIDGRQIQVLDSDPAETDKDGTKKEEQKLIAELQKGLKQTYVPGQTALDSLTVSASQDAIWDLHQGARDLRDPEKGGDPSMSYQLALQKSGQTLLAEMKTAVEGTRFYVEDGEGYSYYNKNLPTRESPNADIFKAITRDPVKAADTLYFKDPTRLTVDAEGRANDSVVRTVARKLGQSDVDYVNSQLRKIAQPEIGPPAPVMQWKPVVENNETTYQLKELIKNNNVSSKAVKRLTKEVEPLNPINFTEGFDGQYPIRDEILRDAIGSVGGNNKGTITVLKNRLENNPDLKKKVWKQVNKQSWPQAFKKAGEDQVLAIRYHAENILFGTMGVNHLDPKVTAYLQNLRKQGVIK